MSHIPNPDPKAAVAEATAALDGEDPVKNVRDIVHNYGGGAAAAEVAAALAELAMEAGEAKAEATRLRAEKIRLVREASWVKEDGMRAVVRAAQKKADDIKAAANTRHDAAAAAEAVAVAAADEAVAKAGAEAGTGVKREE